MRAVGIIVIVPVMLMLLAAMVRASQRVSQPEPAARHPEQRVSV